MADDTANVTKRKPNGLKLSFLRLEDMIKKFLLIFFLFPVITMAQDFSRTWEGFYSYYNIKDVAYAGGKIYTAAENAVFSYQIGSGVIEKTSSIHGLSGENISEIYYSVANKLLLIGYENGLIEIVLSDEDEILAVIDIREKQTISPDRKIINHFLEHEGKVYISTDYGISVFDMSRLEFNESYFVGNNGAPLKVRQTAILGERIYAATENGLMYGNLQNSNLVDYTQWQVFSPGDWNGVVSFDNKIYATNSANQLYLLQGNQIQLVNSYGQKIRDLRASVEALVLTTTTQVRIYDEQLSEIAAVTNIGEDLNLSAAEYFANRIYLGHTTLGLLEVFAPTPTQYKAISPNGPLLNRVFNMTAVPDELWVVYGEYDKDFNPYPITKRGLSYMKNGAWKNFSYEEIQTPELSDVAINPINRQEVYISSYFDGILRFDNGELVDKYTVFNSNLEATSQNAATNSDTRIGGLDFDRQGNLYLSNSIVDNPLKRLAGGKIQNIDVSEGFPDPMVGGTGDVVVGPSGNVFMATMKSGIIAYQPSTGISKGIISSLPGVDFPDGYNPNPVISAMAFDQNNQLWIGTDDGLRVAYGPSVVFQNPSNLRVNPIIFLEGDVAQELLFEQYITDIAVDGKNNKWIATADVGVFYVSPNGQKTIYHFTAENSPLPTNSVNSVEIDEVSGKVYFGTTRGLVAFRGVAVQAQETLANVYVYPNPVRPGYTGLVTIANLTQNANVKITDIEGNLVYETTSDGGNVQWDTQAFGRYKVASGVYLVLITSEDQLDTKVSKIMIIR